MEPRLKPGDIVKNFKRETVNPDSDTYLYQIMAFATHSETDETLVIYQAVSYTHLTLPTKRIV